MTSQHEDHLAQAKRHVAEGERHVADQIARIAQLERDGHDTTQAEAFLKTLEQALYAMREHLRMIVDEQ